MSTWASVRGHSCEGLSAFQAAGGGCKPRVKATGVVTGCDDINPVPFTHCPFCGTAFVVLVATETCSWDFCDCSVEAHADRDANE